MKNGKGVPINGFRSAMVWLFGRDCVVAAGPTKG